jgi:hypothetical protein
VALEHLPSSCLHVNSERHLHIQLFWAFSDELMGHGDPHEEGLVNSSPSSKRVTVIL